MFYKIIFTTVAALLFLQLFPQVLCGHLQHVSVTRVDLAVLQGINVLADPDLQD